MDAAELALFTSEELINELMRRPTFLGVVLHSRDAVKNGQWGDERLFSVRFNDNLDTERTQRLLETVASYLDRHHC